MVMKVKCKLPECEHCGDSKRGVAGVKLGRGFEYPVINLCHKCRNDDSVLAKFRGRFKVVQPW